MLVLCARVQQQAGGSAATVYRTASSISAQVPLLGGAFVPSDFCAAIQGSPLFRVPLLGTVDCKYVLMYNSVYSTRFYIVMWHQILYFLQNLVIPLLLFANKERSSSEKAESPMDRLCFPLSVNALARLLKDNHRRGYTRAWPLRVILNENDNFEIP